jgi:hypothetical protein
MDTFVPPESLYNVDSLDEDIAPEEEPHEELQCNDNIKSKGHCTVRKELSLEEIKERILSLQKPPPARDIAYFRDVCNLNNKEH